MHLLIYALCCTILPADCSNLSSCLLFFTFCQTFLTVFRPVTKIWWEGKVLSAGPALTCNWFSRLVLSPALNAIIRPVLYILRKGECLPAFLTGSGDHPPFSPVFIKDRHIIVSPFFYCRQTTGKAALPHRNNQLAEFYLSSNHLYRKNDSISSSFCLICRKTAPQETKFTVAPFNYNHLIHPNLLFSGPVSSS